MPLSIRVTGTPFTTSTGLPLAEAGTPAAVDEVAALCRDIAARDRVVAVLSGDVQGAALELALAATGRVAEAGVLLSFPDITLGLVPAAGGTQRLPQLVGGAEALRMLLTGASVTAVEALADEAHAAGVAAGDPFADLPRLLALALLPVEGHVAVLDFELFFRVFSSFLEFYWILVFKLFCGDIIHLIFWNFHIKLTRPTQEFYKVKFLLPHFSF